MVVVGVAYLSDKVDDISEKKNTPKSENPDNGDNKPKSNPFEGEPGTEKHTIDNDGNPKQIRKYGDDGWPNKDIDYDHDHGQGKPHLHEWNRPADGSRPTHKNRLPGKPYTP